MATQQVDSDTEGQGEQESPMMTPSSSTMMTSQPGRTAPMRTVQCRIGAKIVAIVNMYGKFSSFIVYHCSAGIKNELLSIFFFVDYGDFIHNVPGNYDNSCGFSHK